MAFRHELDDFARFYERSYPAAYRTALGIVRDPALAADVTQDAYVQAYRQRERFRGEAPVVTWLYRIVVNEALAGLRRRARGPREIAVIDAGSVPGGTDASLGVPDRMAVVAALDELPPRSRAAVVLRYYHDLDYATIATILGTSPGNVGVLLTRALDRMRDVLEPDTVAVPAGGER